MRTIKEEQVYSTLRSQILQGEILIGDKLPSEWQMSKAYEAPRSLIRKVLGQLRQEGFIDSQQGLGSFVIARPDTPTDAPQLIHSLEDVEHCFEYRLEIEPGAAALAAERRTADDIDDMKQITRQLEREIQKGEIGLKYDFELHVKIAKAAQNKFFLSAILALQTDAVFSMTLANQVSVYSPGERYEFIDHEHNAFIDAIIREDPEAARQAMHTHIHNAWQRLKKGSV